MTSIKKQELYRRALRRKSDLEVTAQEKPKTRLRRSKCNTAFSVIKQVCALPDEEKTV